MVKLDGKPLRVGDDVCFKKPVKVLFGFDYWNGLHGPFEGIFGENGGGQTIYSFKSQHNTHVLIFLNEIRRYTGKTPLDEDEERVEANEASYPGGLDDDSQPAAGSEEKCAGHPEAEAAHSSEITEELEEEIAA